MHALDMFFIILMGLLVLRGFLRGFTGEFFSIASLALAFIAAFFLYKNGAVFLRSRYLQMALLPEIFSFIAVFLIVFIAGKIMEHIVKDIIERLNLGTLDKALGIILGLAEALAVIVLIFFLFGIQPFFDSAPIFAQSIFARLLLPLMGSFHV